MQVLHVTKDQSESKQTIEVEPMLVAGGAREVMFPTEDDLLKAHLGSTDIVYLLRCGDRSLGRSLQLIFETTIRIIHEGAECAIAMGELIVQVHILTDSPVALVLLKTPLEIEICRQAELRMNPGEG